MQERKREIVQPHSLICPQNKFGSCPLYSVPSNLNQSPCIKSTKFLLYHVSGYSLYR